METRWSGVRNFKSEYSAVSLRVPFAEVTLWVSFNSLLTLKNYLNSCLECIINQSGSDSVGCVFGGFIFLSKSVNVENTRKDKNLLQIWTVEFCQNRPICLSFYALIDGDDLRTDE